MTGRGAGPFAVDATQSPYKVHAHMREVETFRLRYRVSEIVGAEHPG
jgi:hypothetical protein